MFNQITQLEPANMTLADNDNDSAKLAALIEKTVQADNIYVYRQFLTAEAEAAAAAIEDGRPATTQRKSKFGVTMGLLTVLFTIGGFILGVMYGGTPTNGAGDLDNVEPPPIEGRVIFSGAGNGVGAGRMNPEAAKLQIDDYDGALTILDWWITSSDSATILYESGAGEVEDALIELRESNEQGIYYLFYRFENDSGFVYKLGSNFFIKDMAEGAG